MKKLYIIRHAKSSWDEPGLSDFERPLNDRGKRDAPRMAKRLKEKEIHPDLMLSSPAKRALSTCKRIAGVLNYAPEKIKTDQRLYHASDDQILKVLKELNDKQNEVLLFGHNPGLTDFVNEFTSDETYIPNIPTCGVIAYEINIDTWKELDWGKGDLQFFDYPKNRTD